jgi:type IX secretion system PorP/SprF family membrane protein
MKKLIILFCIAGLGLASNAQQDPQYSLYQFNQMIINPAYAGARDGLAAVATNRQQWVGFSGAPKTTCLSVHAPILKKNIGVGGTLTNDIMGPRNVTSIYANFAYWLKITNQWKLSFGLNAGFNRYQFNFNKIDFQQTEAPSQLFQNQVNNTLDINGGLYLKSNTFFFGVSATHLNTPKVYTYDAGNISYRLATHIFITAGNSFMINRDVIFAPTVMVKLVDGNVNLDLNANFFLYKKMWAGVFYRMGYGPGGLVQYYLNNRLRVGLAYDTGLQAARRLGPSFEAMIGFDVAANKAKMVNPRFL